MNGIMADTNKQKQERSLTIWKAPLLLVQLCILARRSVGEVVMASYSFGET